MGSDAIFFIDKFPRKIYKVYVAYPEFPERRALPRALERSFTGTSKSVDRDPRTGEQVLVDKIHFSDGITLEVATSSTQKIARFVKGEMPHHQTDEIARTERPQE